MEIAFTKFHLVLCIAWQEAYALQAGPGNLGQIRPCSEDHFLQWCEQANGRGVELLPGVLNCRTLNSPKLQLQQGNQTVSILAAQAALHQSCVSAACRSNAIRQVPCQIRSQTYIVPAANQEITAPMQPVCIANACLLVAMTSINCGFD